MAIGVDRAVIEVQDTTSYKDGEGVTFTYAQSAEHPGCMCTP